MLHYMGLATEASFERPVEHQDLFSNDFFYYKSFTWGFLRNINCKQKHLIYLTNWIPKLQQAGINH